MGRFGSSCQNAVNRLIAPLEAYVLLPDRLCNTSVTVESGNLNLLTPCFSDLLTKTLQNSRCLTNVDLSPVNWFSLLIEPQKIVSVVAAVLPVIGSDVENEHFRRNKMLIETISGIKQWDFDLLINLQVLVLVPWPDPTPEVFENEKPKHHTAPHNNTSIQKERPIRVGKSSLFYQSFYIDLDLIAQKGIKTYIVSNLFQQSTAELVITLLTILSRGIFKDSDTTYQNWLHLLMSHNVTELGKLEKLKEFNLKQNYTNLKLTKIRKSQNCNLLKTLKALSKSNHVIKKTFNKNRISKLTKLTPQSMVIGNMNTVSKQIYGSRLGMIGLLNELSKQIAHMAQVGLGMQISYYQKHPLPKVSYMHYSELKDLLQANDFIILADDTLNKYLPNNIIQLEKINKSIEHKCKPKLWLTHEHFNNFNPNAFLIAVTVTQCIDFVALTRALLCHQLSGAGITMPIKWFTKISDLDRLRNLPNTFILPPATSSICSTPEIRFYLVQHIIELITCGLTKSSSFYLEDNSSAFKANRINKSCKLFFNSLNKKLSKNVTVSKNNTELNNFNSNKSK